MWSRVPDVGERVVVEKIESVSWPDRTALHGVVTHSEPEDQQFRFLPDLPDPSRNGNPESWPQGQTAREFDHEYGWHVDARYGDKWIPEDFVINEEEELPWIIHRG